MIRDALDINPRHLRAVLAVAENRSFIAAAASLKISQPALTRTIKQVERELGVELFSRTTRQVVITQAGKELVSLAERLLNDLRIGLSSLQKLGAHQRGQVIVSSVLSFADVDWSKSVTHFHEEFSGVDVHLREGMQASVIDDVRSGVADFGIGYLNSLPDIFTTEVLGIETLHVVLPLRHSLARHNKIDINELRQLPLVSYPYDARTRQLIDNVAMRAGFAPHHLVTVNRVPTLMSLVQSGVGVAIVPSSERPAARERQLTSRPLASAPITRLGIIRLRERTLTPPAETLLKLTKEWVRMVSPKQLRAAHKTTRKK